MCFVQSDFKRVLLYVCKRNYIRDQHVTAIGGARGWQKRTGRGLHTHTHTHTHRAISHLSPMSCQWPQLSLINPFSVWFLEDCTDKRWALEHSSVLRHTTTETQSKCAEGQSTSRLGVYMTSLQTAHREVIESYQIVLGGFWVNVPLKHTNTNSNTSFSQTLCDYNVLLASFLHSFLHPPAYQPSMQAKRCKVELVCLQQGWISKKNTMFPLLLSSCLPSCHCWQPASTACLPHSEPFTPPRCAYQLTLTN